MSALRSQRIAVTGATGFLGRYIVDVLLARGAHVIAVVRNPDRVPALKQRGVELRPADLLQPDRLKEGFRGADAVVSNAALFAVQRMVGFSAQHFAEHQRVNIDGTSNVFNAAAAAGVSRVVQVSSVAVYGLRTSANATEDHPQLDGDTRPTPFNAYQLSKALSEQRAWQLAAQHRLALTTVRPSGIYGAFDPNLTRVLKALLRAPISVLPLMLRLPMVYAGDVADGIARALENPIAVGKAYHTTGDDLPFSDFVRAWKEAGGPAPRLMLPLPTPFRQTFDHSRIRTDLGWSNRPFTAALRETFALEAAEG